LKATEMKEHREVGKRKAQSPIFVPQYGFIAIRRLLHRMRLLTKSLLKESHPNAPTFRIL